LAELKGIRRAFVVTDKTIFDMDYSEKVTHLLDNMNIQHQVFYHVTPSPTLSAVRAGLREVNDFKPDAIIAIGGGSPIDAAKVMWLMYEHPETKFEDSITRSLEARKTVNAAPSLGSRALMIAIPTTSGTGAEVTPFSVIVDDQGKKQTVASYSLTPSMSILDPQLVISLPPQLRAYGGMMALEHAVESFTSLFTSEYTRGLCKQAIPNLFKFLPRAVHNGNNDYHACEKVHNSATMAGMAFANTMLGVGHSLSYTLGETHGLPHGLVSAVMMPHVMRFNAKGSPKALEDYGKLSDLLQLGGTSPQDKLDKLVERLGVLRGELQLPGTLQEVLGGVKEAEYKASVEEMAKRALEDINTEANPCPVSPADVKALYLAAWGA